MTDLNRIIRVEMRPAELGAAHGREFELLLHHDATTRTVVGISGETMGAWADMHADYVTATRTTASQGRGVQSHG